MLLGAPNTTTWEGAGPSAPGTARWGRAVLPSAGAVGISRQPLEVVAGLSGLLEGVVRLQAAGREAHDPQAAALLLVGALGTEQQEHQSELEGTVPRRVEQVHRHWEPSLSASAAVGSVAVGPAAPSQASRRLPWRR